MFFIIIVLSIIVSTIGFGLFAIYVTIKKLRKHKILEKDRDNRFSIGIFHPFCTNGNPEERVLWGVVSALQSKFPNYRYIVYTGDTDSPPERILSNARIKLNVSLNTASAVEFVYLQKRYLVDPGRYPRFPRFGINIGSILLGLEAIWKFVPDVYLDTVGYPFTLPIFKYIGGCRVGCYLSMSPDIIYAFPHRGYNQPVRNKYVKLFQRITYSKLYKFCSSWAGQSSDIILVNSTWAENYINDLWDCQSKVCRVYPPCAVEALQNLIREDDEHDHVQIVSLAQFVPQADHPLQIRTLFQLRQLVSDEEWDRIRLLFIGTSNTSQDSARVKDMQDLCKHLSLEENVIFKLNLPYDEVMKELADSLIGIHTTYSEFSIGLVECLAAGVITVAHNSGGTTKDIAIDYRGARNVFLASDELEYADAIKHIILMRPDCRTIIRNQSRASVDRFSEAQFKKNFLMATGILFK